MFCLMTALQAHLELMISMTPACNMSVAQNTEHHLYECLVLWLAQQNTKNHVVYRTLVCVHQQWVPYDAAVATGM